MEKQVRELIAAVKPGIGAENIGSELDLNDAGFDSLDIASLLLAIQERFNLQISDADAEGLVTIDAIAAYLDANAKSA
jgi:acyl carrier protein